MLQQKILYKFYITYRRKIILSEQDKYIQIINQFIGLATK